LMYLCVVISFSVKERIHALTRAKGDRWRLLGFEFDKFRIGIR
jgi:hypothetical protein